jgi:hypothetical protein
VADRSIRKKMKTKRRRAFGRSSPWSGLMKRSDPHIQPESMAPCGLDCALCPDYKGYPRGFSVTAERMRVLLRQHRFAAKVATEHGKFDLHEFSKGLAWFTRQKNMCTGCSRRPMPTRSVLLPGCDLACPIRTCADDRGIRVCSACPDFPCFRSQYSRRGLAHLRRGLDRKLPGNRL